MLVELISRQPLGTRDLIHGRKPLFAWLMLVLVDGVGRGR